MGADRSEIILPAVKTKIPLTEQFRVQTAKALAYADALGKMSFRRRKERDKVCATRTLVVDRKRFRTGRTTDIDNLASFSFKAYEVPVPITKDRTDDEQTFARFAFQQERQPRMTLKFMPVRKDRMAIRAIAFGDHFSFLRILVRNHLAFLRLVPTQK
jgi:hypothetical protein